MSGRGCTLDRARIADWRCSQWRRYTFEMGENKMPSNRGRWEHGRTSHEESIVNEVKQTSRVSQQRMSCGSGHSWRRPMRGVETRYAGMHSCRRRTQRGSRNGSCQAYSDAGLSHAGKENQCEGNIVRQKTHLNGVHAPNTDPTLAK
jgi:hypothetical protein